MVIAGDVERANLDRDGARGYYVTRPQDIADTVAAALKNNLPNVIEIPVAEYFPQAATLPGTTSGH